MKVFAPVSPQETNTSFLPTGKNSSPSSGHKGYKARTTYPLPAVQRKENKTAMPDHLKSRIENLSGIAMDDVKVHYNSSKPVGLNALAYAHGADIHLAPGQEKHLGHEAWHVVQQKQGLVQPTSQMKNGVAVNDNKELETKADEMGEKASATKEMMPEQPGSAARSITAVIQRRLPKMEKAELLELFNQHPKLAIELLLHSIDNLSNEEIEVIYSKAGQRDFSMADLKNFVNTIEDAEEFYFKYKLLNDSINASSKYRSTIDLPDLQETFPEQEAVIDKMQQLSDEIGLIVNHVNHRHEGLLKVFGLNENDDDRISHVSTVYSSIKAQLDNSITSNKLPFVIITEGDHNEWARIGAQAPQSGKPITLPQLVINEFLAGSKVYTALLVHELSHKATPKTNDETDYNLDSIKLLPPARRIINAESYALGYREIFEGADPKRYYDASLFKNTGVGSAVELVSPQDVVTADIQKFLRRLWAKINDSYKCEKQIYNAIKSGGSAKDLASTPGFRNLQAAVFPLGNAIPTEFDAIRALLEDRSRAIFVRVNTTDYINEMLQNELAALESTEKGYIQTKLIEMIPRLLQGPFHFSENEAKVYAVFWLKEFGFIS